MFFAASSNSSTASEGSGIPVKLASAFAIELVPGPGFRSVERRSRLVMELASHPISSAAAAFDGAPGRSNQARTSFFHLSGASLGFPQRAFLATTSQKVTVGGS